jgi:hypothetical protein
MLGPMLQAKHKLLIGIGLVFALLLGGWLVRASRAEPSRAEGASGERAGSGEVARPVGAGEGEAPVRAELRGAVLSRDELGKSIAGARVCAWPLDEAGRLGPALAVRCARSGADGRYALELEPGRYRVVASAAGHRPATWSDPEHGKDAQPREWLALGVGQRREQIDLALARGGVRLAGRVEDIAGGAIEGALITSQTHFPVRPAATALSDAEGRFELWVEPGEYRVEAHALGYAPARSLARAPHAELELRLIPESVLVGRVVDAETGAGLAGVRVTPQPWLHAHPVVVSGEDGSFRIAGLEPGRYQPEARGDAVYGLAPGEVELALGQTSEPVELKVYPARQIRAQLVALEPGGGERPCSAGRVTLRGSGLIREAGADAEGRVGLDAVLPGHYWLRPYCPDRLELAERELDVTAAPDAGETLRFEFEPGYMIRGRTLDLAGHGVPDIHVLAEGPGAGHQQSGERGRFELGPLPSGSYVVWARLDELVRVEVELGEEDLEGVELTVGEFGGLRGFVRDGEGGALPDQTLEVRSTKGRQVGIPRSDGEGRFTLEGLPVGDYVVGFMGDNQPRVPFEEIVGERVTVRSGEISEVELVGEAPGEGSISGTVSEAGGPAGDAWVVAGRGSAAALERDYEIGPVLCEQDGRFVIDGLAEGSWAIRAYHGSSVASVEGVELGAEVALALEPQARLAGQVRLVGGRVPEHFAARISGAGRPHELQFHRTQGRFEFTGLAAGKWTLEVVANEGRGSTEVELGAGEAREDLEVELDARVTIRARLVAAHGGEGVASVRVGVQGAGSFYNEKVVAGADGRFELRGVPIGQVTLLVTPNSWGVGRYGMQLLPVTTAAEPPVQELGELRVFGRRVSRSETPGKLGFRLVPKPKAETTQVEVASVEPGGPAAEAGLRVGDSITAIDGTSVEGATSGQLAVLLMVPPGTEVVLARAQGEPISVVAGD